MKHAVRYQNGWLLYALNLISTRCINASAVSHTTAGLDYQLMVIGIDASGTDQIQCIEQPSILITTGHHQRRHAAGTVGLVLIDRNRLALSWSTMIQMWARICTKITSTSKISRPHTRMTMSLANIPAWRNGTKCRKINLEKGRIADHCHTHCWSRTDDEHLGSLNLKQLLTVTAIILLNFQQSQNTKGNKWLSLGRKNRHTFNSLLSRGQLAYADKRNVNNSGF